VELDLVEGEGPEIAQRRITGAAILEIVQDRSEVNAAKRQISDTRSLLDSIVDNMPVGVFVKEMEADGLYVLLNEACGDIVGMRAEH
ncbi:hypothetical protein ACC687_39595, partial [Rhizobium ruizarguesonis]